jgi:hypothetical protein
MVTRTIGIPVLSDENWFGITTVWKLLAIYGNSASYHIPRRRPVMVIGDEPSTRKADPPGGCIYQ